MLIHLHEFHDNDKFIARSILKFHWDPQLPATFWLNCCHGPLPRVSFGSGPWERVKKHLGVQVTPLLVFKWLGIMPGNSSVQMARFLDKFEVWHSMHINIFFNKKALRQIICRMQNLQPKSVFITIFDKFNFLQLLRSNDYLIVKKLSLFWVTAQL